MKQNLDGDKEVNEYVQEIPQSLQTNPRHNEEEPQNI